MKSEIILVLNNNLFIVKKSKIHDMGLFSLSSFPVGFEFGPSVINKSKAEIFKDFIGDQSHPELKWNFVQTTATKFINHSYNPNMEYYLKDGCNEIIYARCLRNIEPNDEITLNYKDHIIMSEDCTDPDVIKLYSEILGITKEELLEFIKSESNK